MKKFNLIWLFALILLGCQKDELDIPDPHFKVSRLQSTSDTDKVPNLSFDIAFLDLSKPLQKGHWILSKDRLSLVLRFKNTTDSICFIDPPHYSPFRGNPTFFISAVDTSQKFGPDRILQVNFAPWVCISLPANAQLLDTLDLLSLNSYNFRRGQEYVIQAHYYSAGRKLRDELGIERRTNSIKLASNTLRFVYP